MPAPRTIASVRATPELLSFSPLWIAAFKSGIKPCTYRRLESSKMKFIGALAAALSLAGRHGTLLAATSIFVGLAVPRLAAACKPFLGEAIVAILTLAFLRVDPADLRRH